MSTPSDFSQHIQRKERALNLKISPSSLHNIFQRQKWSLKYNIVETTALPQGSYELVGLELELSSSKLF